MENFIVAHVYSIKYISTSYMGNPRYELATSAGKLRTKVDGSIGYSLPNLERLIRETQPKMELSGTENSIWKVRVLTGDLLDEIIPGVWR